MTGLVTRLRDQVLDRNRWGYFYRSITGFLLPSRWRCPNCGGDGTESVDRKLLVTQLVRCRRCQLQFRVPTDPPRFGESFYQEDYSQGFTTDCPSEEQLAEMLKVEFRGTPKDFRDQVALLKTLGLDQGTRVLDFGASWGYGTWQFGRAGFDVQGIEPGRSRARYARDMLHVDVVDQESDVKGPFDVVFSSHVLEHVPSPTGTIRQMAEWLRPGGLLVAYTPNGSRAYRDRDPKSFSNHWGMVHPNYLDELYYQHALEGWRSVITGTPVDMECLRNWDRQSNVVSRLNSWEILVIAVRPSTLA